MGNTALMRAIQLNYLDAVYFLLQHPDIDVNLKNEVIGNLTNDVL